MVFPRNKTGDFSKSGQSVKKSVFNQLSWDLQCNRQDYICFAKVNIQGAIAFWKLAIAFYPDCVQVYTERVDVACIS